jgi:hypothetical protein
MADFKFQSRLKEYPEHAAALGIIIDTCSTIEKVCCEIVAGLLGVSDAKAEAIIYSLQNSRAQFDITQALTVKFAPEKVRQKIVDELESARRLFRLRNDLTHGMWISRWNKLRIHHPKKQQRARERAVSIKEMHLLLADLETCLNKLISLSGELRT